MQINVPKTPVGTSLSSYCISHRLVLCTDICLCNALCRIANATLVPYKNGGIGKVLLTEDEFSALRLLDVDIIDNAELSVRLYDILNYRNEQEYKRRISDNI